MTRREFVQLCVSALIERDMGELQMAAETYGAAQVTNGYMTVTSRLYNG